MFSASKTSGPSGYNLTNSLRFRESAGAYLNRTFSTPTNNKIWTWSGWVKRGLDSSASDRMLFSGTSNGTSTIGSIFFDGGTDSLRYIDFTSPSTYGANVRTTQVFRDFSAWYHIVVAVDTTQATNSNRLKMYVNGTQITAFAVTSYPALNANTFINSAQQHRLGSYPYNSPNYDGYMAEVNFIDGQALTPSSFGSTNATTGVWQPARYSGTYGTNGFYLKFSDIATTSGSNAGLGKDFSGNANYWNTNNISVTAGSTYDAMIDSPTLTSATVANYAVLNPLDKGTSVAVSNGNLTPSIAAAAWQTIRATMAFPTTGKWYVEGLLGGSSGNGLIGIGTASAGLASYAGADANGWSYNAGGGQKFNNATGVAYGATYAPGDVIGVAFDADAGTLTFYKNNTSQGTAFTGLTSGPYFLMPSVNASEWAINFGQRPFTYTAPSGFVALNTYNLPDSTIKKGNTVMDATLYTGNGFPTAGTQSITNASAFQPDFVWIKDRSNGTNYHALFDSIRGINNRLFSNTTDSQNTTTGTLTAFNSNGFTLGSQEGQNANGNSLVAWQWQAGQGTTSSGTGTGGITSVTQSVNATAGFSIVTYTGSGSNGTVTHGLGVAPKWVIVKARSVAGENWQVYSSSLTSAAYRMRLNATDAQDSQPTMWNSTAPTSTVFSVGTASGVNTSAVTYVAYCWAEIAGFSKFGSYTGNGSANGPFLYTGFRPKFVLIKRTDTATDWHVEDASRNLYNVTNNTLYPNTSSAETANDTVVAFDFLSNGFKLRASHPTSNGSGGTYIYMAFAENPLKNSLAR